MTDEKECTCNKEFMNTGTWLMIQEEKARRDKLVRTIRTVDDKGNAYDEHGTFIIKLF